MNNAQVYSGHAEGCVGHWPPPYALCSSALPWRLLSAILSYISVISQYISVLRISGSQDISVLRISGSQDLRISQLFSVISQYISVYLIAPLLGPAARPSCRIMRS